jgi:hypothetical protein
MALTGALVGLMGALIGVLRGALVPMALEPQAVQ